jgi:serine phosphatase RsbU (regulator of sigma subunit)
MKLPNFLSRPALAARTPAPLVLPEVDSVRVDLQYHWARTGGDFFDALACDASRLVFLLMDIAGRRAGAMELAAFVQDEFRSRTPGLFTAASNEAEALSELCMRLNRAILASAGRAHMSAAFLGVLNGGVGALTYINAGHVPGLLLTANSTEFLESTGLPLGLFSHATHEASLRVIPPRRRAPDGFPGNR